MRTRDDVHRDELADAARRRGTGIGRSLHGRDVAADDRGHVAGADFLPADQRDLRGLHHRVGRLDHRDQALRFNHPKRLTHYSLLYGLLRLIPALSPSAFSPAQTITVSYDRVFDESGEFAVC